MLRNDLIDLVVAARSIRDYKQAPPVLRENMESMVNAARLCPSAANRQPLKYKISTEKEEVDKIFALTRWAGLIKDRKVPPEGKGPTGFITICHDLSISPRSEFGTMDVGIAAAVINLSACEKGFGTCMIGSFDKEKVKELLALPEDCEPVLLMAVGTPDQSPILCKPVDGDVNYFRDDADLHFVPKRTLEEIIIK